MLRQLIAVGLVGVAFALAGCGSAIHNKPLAQYDPQAGYRFDNLEPGEGNTDETFIILTFSGGGSRASAFSYGVLKGLRDTEIPGLTESDPPRQLLDEVDAISSVSGGSFTAMGLGLWGDDLFDGRFEERFLYHNVQRDLLLGMLNPLNGIALFSGIISESDISSNYYHDRIFEQKTYADLRQRPFVLINATDITRKQSFQFAQSSFDLLGSDLTQLPVAWSVAASSAFPFLLSPMRLKYHHGDAMDTAVEKVVTTEDTRIIQRQRRWAKSLLTREAAIEGHVEVDKAGHQYMYLVDGGLSDNLGLFPVLEAFESGPLHDRLVAGKIKRFVVVIVNAATRPPDQSEASPIAPSQLMVGIKTMTTAMDNLSQVLSAIAQFAFLEAKPAVRTAHNRVIEAARKACPDAELPELPPEDRVEYYVLNIDFDEIVDLQLREKFLTVGTNFSLPKEHVDAIIELGRQLVMEHPEMRRLLDSFKK